jgi:hypothetical protein
MHLVVHNLSSHFSLCVQCAVSMTRPVDAPDFPFMLLQISPLPCLEGVLNGDVYT